MNEINFNIEDIETIYLSMDVGIKEIYPPIENLNVVPTKEQQIFTHENSYGYDKVTVEPIPDEYAIPTGTLEITTNGEHNVKDYEKVVTDVHEVSKYAPRYISFYGYSGSELQQELENLSLENMTSATNMFRYMGSSMKELDLSSLDFSTITSFYNTFYDSQYLTTINFGNSVPKPITLESMCNNCRRLETLDISHFDGSEINGLSQMCYGNYALKTIVLPSNLGENINAVNFYRCFQYCSALEEVDWSYLHCSVSDMSQMFDGCTLLKRVDFRNITNHFKPNVNTMFRNCTSLEYIDIRSLDMSSVTSGYSTMLSGVPTTCEIIVKDDANKQWFNEKLPTYTNVKTVAEL